MVNYFFVCGVNVCFVNVYGDMVFYLVCLLGEVDIVKVLFFYGVELEWRGASVNCLIYFVCFGGFEDVVMILIFCGCCVNVINVNGVLLSVFL